MKLVDVEAPDKPDGPIVTVLPYTTDASNTHVEHSALIGALDPDEPDASGAPSPPKKRNHVGVDPRPQTSLKCS